MNTAQKRMSAMNLASPWRGPLVDATESGTTQGNRQAAAFMYSGILATEGIDLNYALCVCATDYFVPGAIAADYFIPGAQAAQGGCGC